MLMGVSILHMIFFISLQIIILSVVKSDSPAPYNNATDHGSLWKSSRSKRSLFKTMPWILKIKVKYATGEEVTLKWIKVNPTLADEHLPVITSTIGPNPAVMKDVGEFVMYHDLNQCSAVVYFKNNHKLYGAIGIHHHVRDLPFDFDSQGNYRMGVVGEPFITTELFPFGHIHPKKISHSSVDSGTLNEFAGSVQSHMNENNKRPIDSEAGPTSKHQRVAENLKADDTIRTMNTMKYNSHFQEYYVETLIFVPTDISLLFKHTFGEQHYIRYIVRYYLAYFNILDMIFKKTQTLLRPLHLNIAKIIIENNLLPFSFMNNDAIQFSAIATKLPEYLQSHSNEYAPDLFDYVFIQTSRPIWSGLSIVEGITKHGANLYEARKNNQFYDMVPISAVQYENGNFYHVAAHEFGLIFNLGIDLCDERIKTTGQCYSIMQEEGPKCVDCLNWSDESKRKFSMFFSTNPNRCFFLNYPHSLKRSLTIQPLHPNKQCECFGYNSYIKSPNGEVLRSIREDECSKPLQCQNGKESNVESTVLPFDGTPCATNKICQNRNCI